MGEEEGTGATRSKRKETSLTSLNVTSGVTYGSGVRPARCRSVRMSPGTEALRAGFEGGLVGISGARRMPIDHTYPLPVSMAPKGALRPQYARFPNAHPNGHPPVTRASLGHNAPWGAILPGSG